MRASAASISDSHEVIETYLDCMEALNAIRRALYDPGRPRQPNLANETIRLLSQYQFDRALGAYCLIVNGLVWDAEIIIRTVYETAAKIILLGASSLERRSELAEEYWSILLSIYDRKGAEKAGQAEKLARDFSEANARIFRALRDPKAFDIDAVGNKRYRSEVENRWSFSGILKTLSSSGPNHIRVVGLDALAHMYGMMSHLAHASPKSLELMEDRTTRGEDLLILEKTHIYRMLNDLISLACFSLWFSYRAEKQELPVSPSLDDIFEKMGVAGVNVRREFDASQNTFYSQF